MAGARKHVSSGGVADKRSLVRLFLRGWFFGSRFLCGWLLGSCWLCCSGLGSWFLSRCFGGSWLLCSSKLYAGSLGSLREVCLASGSGVLVDQVVLDGLIDLALSLAQGLARWLGFEFLDGSLDRTLRRDVTFVTKSGLLYTLNS